MECPIKRVALFIKTEFLSIFLFISKEKAILKQKDAGHWRHLILINLNDTGGSCSSRTADGSHQPANTTACPMLEAVQQHLEGYRSFIPSPNN